MKYVVSRPGPSTARGRWRRTIFYSVYKNKSKAEKAASFRRKGLKPVRVSRFY